MKASDLNTDHFNSYYQQYIDKVGNVPLMTILQKQAENFPKFIASIPEDKMNFSYAEEKWTVGQSLQHIIDTERVFQYRALRFSRNDKTPLPSFDQDVFVAAVDVSGKTKLDFIEEYSATRSATISLFKSFNTDTLKKFGIASNAPSSVASLGFIICGHQRHHRDIIRERYY